MGKNKNQQEQDKVDPIEMDEHNEQENVTENVTEEVSAENQLKMDLETANDRYMRLYAEFDNYKRRTAKERVELMQSAGKEVISNLLTVVDDFDRALKMMDTASDVTAVKEGIELISQKFKKILQQQGLKEMNVIGEAFDADFQEAI